MFCDSVSVSLLRSGVHFVSGVRTNVYEGAIPDALHPHRRLVGGCSGLRLRKMSGPVRAPFDTRAVFF